MNEGNSSSMLADDFEEPTSVHFDGCCETTLFIHNIPNKIQNAHISQIKSSLNPFDMHNDATIDIKKFFAMLKLPTCQSN